VREPLTIGAVDAVSSRRSVSTIGAVGASCAISTGQRFCNQINISTVTVPKTARSKADPLLRTYLSLCRSCSLGDGDGYASRRHNGVRRRSRSCPQCLGIV
jgi:hypothetical protein